MATHERAGDRNGEDVAPNEPEVQSVDIDNLPGTCSVRGLRRSVHSDVYETKKALFLTNGVKRIKEETTAVPMSVEKTKLFRVDLKAFGVDVCISKYREHAILKGEEAFARTDG